MAITLINYPALDFNPSQGCLELEFSSDLLDITGTPANVVITFAQLALLDIDSFVSLNGVKWSFGTASNLDENIILFDTSTTNLAFAILAAILTNGFFTNNFNTGNSFVDAVGLNILMPDAKNDAEFIMSNLPNGQNDITISDSPEKIDLPSNYAVIAKLKCNGLDIEGIKESGIYIPVSTVVNCEETAVESYQIKRDISSFVQGCVSTPFPSFDPVNLMRYLPSRTAQFIWSYYEARGNPVQYYARKTGERFNILNYAIQDNLFDEFLGVLNPSVTPGGTQFMTSYDEGDNICVGQHNWIHFIYNHDDVPTNVSFRAVFNTSAGSTNSALYNLPVNQKLGDVLEIQAGLQNLEQLATGVGIDICDVTSYVIVLAETNGAGEVTHQFPFTVDRKCNCISEFMFLSSQGVYETIALNCPSEIIIESVREFCATCEACNVSILTPKNKIIAVNSSEVFNVNFLKRSHYNDRIINEFLNSTDVYFCQDGEFYAIEPITTSAIDYLKKGNVLNQYQFRINQFKSLFN